MRSGQAGGLVDEKWIRRVGTWMRSVAVSIFG